MHLNDDYYHSVDYNLYHHDKVARIAKSQHQLHVYAPEVLKFVIDQLTRVTEEQELTSFDEDDKNGKCDHKSNEVKKEGHLLAYPPKGRYVFTHTNRSGSN